MEEDLLFEINNSNNLREKAMKYSVGILIKDYDVEFREYRLGFPNEEVERGFEAMRHRMGSR